MKDHVCLLEHPHRPMSAHMQRWVVLRAWGASVLKRDHIVLGAKRKAEDEDCLLEHPPRPVSACTRRWATMRAWGLGVLREKNYCSRVLKVARHKDHELNLPTGAPQRPVSACMQRRVR